MNIVLSYALRLTAGLSLLIISASASQVTLTDVAFDLKKAEGQSAGSWKTQTDSVPGKLPHLWIRKSEGPNSVFANLHDEPPQIFSESNNRIVLAIGGSLDLAAKPVLTLSFAGTTQILQLDLATGATSASTTLGDVKVTLYPPILNIGTDDRVGSQKPQPDGNRDSQVSFALTLEAISAPVPTSQPVLVTNQDSSPVPVRLTNPSTHITADISNAQLPVAIQGTPSVVVTNADAFRRITQQGIAYITISSEGGSTKVKVVWIGMGASPISGISKPGGNADLLITHLSSEINRITSEGWVIADIDSTSPQTVVLLLQKY